MLILKLINLDIELMSIPTYLQQIITFTDGHKWKIYQTFNVANFAKVT